MGLHCNWRACFAVAQRVCDEVVEKLEDLTAIGGNPPYTFSSSLLPPGLTLGLDPLLELD